MIMEILNCICNIYQSNKNKSSYYLQTVGTIHRKLRKYTQKILSYTFFIQIHSNNQQTILE